MSEFSRLLLLAQVEHPIGQSFLSWAINSLGPFYASVLPALGLLLLVGACMVVASGRRPAVIAAYLVFLPLPILVGLYGTVEGFLASFQVIAMSSAAPKPAEVSDGIATGLFTLLVGLMVTFPAYLVTAIGLFVRTAAVPKSG